MGGAGAGKTAVEEIARSRCGDNFVVASLDEFRKQSDLYLVLTAANHHSDDYIYVEPFANSLRDWVASQARQQAMPYRLLLCNRHKKTAHVERFCILQFFQSAFAT